MAQLKEIRKPTPQSGGLDCPGSGHGRFVTHSGATRGPSAGPGTGTGGGHNSAGRVVCLDHKPGVD